MSYTLKSACELKKQDGRHSLYLYRLSCYALITNFSLNVMHSCGDYLRRNIYLKYVFSVLCAGPRVASQLCLICISSLGLVLDSGGESLTWLSLSVGQLWGSPHQIPSFNLHEVQPCRPGVSHSPGTQTVDSSLGHSQLTFRIHVTTHVFTNPQVPRFVSFGYPSVE